MLQLVSWIKMTGIATTASLLLMVLIYKGEDLCCWILPKKLYYYCLGDAKVELNISNTIYAGQTINGSCIFTGVNKPRYIRVSGMDPNGKVEGGLKFGQALQHANYINNFKITCSKSNISFDLDCSTDTTKTISKPVQGK